VESPNTGRHQFPATAHFVTWFSSNQPCLAETFVSCYNYLALGLLSAGLQAAACCCSLLIFGVNYGVNCLKSNIGQKRGGCKKW